MSFERGVRRVGNGVWRRIVAGVEGVPFNNTHFPLLKYLANMCRSNVLEFDLSYNTFIAITKESGGDFAIAWSRVSIILSHTTNARNITQKKRGINNV